LRAKASKLNPETYNIVGRIHKRESTKEALPRNFPKWGIIFGRRIPINRKTGRRIQA
jgi:hypothetical protein